MRTAGRAALGANALVVVKRARATAMEATFMVGQQWIDGMDDLLMIFLENYENFKPCDDE